MNRPAATTAQPVTVEVRTWFDQYHGLGYHSLRLVRDGETLAALPMVKGRGKTLYLREAQALAEGVELETRPAAFAVTIKEVRRQEDLYRY